MASLSVGAENLKLFCNLLAVYKIGERFFGRLALICIQISFSSLPLVHSLYVVRKAQCVSKAYNFLHIQKDIARRF